MRPRDATRLAVFAACVFAAPVQADPASTQATLESVTVTAVPGTSIDIDKIPGNAQVLGVGDLTREGSASLTQALSSTLSSVSVNDDLDDPFQPDILYRGFEASPVLGTPQGLAVYQNGVRINEAFADTVNWDLVPDIAIRQVEIVSASPVYGLNALGGAVAVTMKDGFSYRGADLELSGGSYGQRAVTAQLGTSSDAYGVYVAARALDWNGWRSFSSDRLRDLYASASVRIDRATVDLSYTRADNILDGQGSAPIQELAVNRSLVFTGPQSDRNALNFFALSGTWAADAGWSAQGVIYYRDYAQSVANGNTTQYIACTNGSGLLCQPDGITPLADAQGRPLPDISRGGTLYIGENDHESIRAWGRGGTVQLSDSQPLAPGHDNQFNLGASIDYASTRFDTGAELGLINSRLLVLPSALSVDTPESSPGALANGDPVPISLDSVNTDLGVFLADTLNLTPELALTASGRYNLARVDLADQLGANLDGHDRFAHFNPALGATYKILPTLTVYGGWSENTRTPTAGEIECSDPRTPCLLPTNLAGDPPSLKQVVARTVELGLRGKLTTLRPSDRELDWNLSVFRTLLENDIFGVATSVSRGFFQNIGDTRRQGVEAGLHFHSSGWSGYLSYSFVQAEFLSPLLVPSPSNPYRNASGDIQVVPGDQLPGIPEHRVKLGIDRRFVAGWTLGATVSLVSSVRYVGDESNQLDPIPGYATVQLHANYKPVDHLELFASINNLFDRKYATWGILSDPTGAGAPGVPPQGRTDGPGVDPRFLSPAAPFEAFAGVRLLF